MAPHYKCYDLTTGPCKNTNIEKHTESGHMIGVSKNPDDLLILANLACSWSNKRGGCELRDKWFQEVFSHISYKVCFCFRYCVLD